MYFTKEFEVNWVVDPYDSEYEMGVEVITINEEGDDVKFLMNIETLEDFCTTIKDHVEIAKRGDDVNI